MGVASVYQPAGFSGHFQVKQLLKIHIFKYLRRMSLFAEFYPSVWMALKKISKKKTTKTNK